MATTLTTSEAAKYLGLSAKRVRELALRGKLPGRPADAGWLFAEADLKRFKSLDRPRGKPKGSPKTGGRRKSPAP